MENLLLIPQDKIFSDKNGHLSYIMLMTEVILASEVSAGSANNATL